MSCYPCIPYYDIDSIQSVFCVIYALTMDGIGIKLPMKKAQVERRSRKRSLVRQRVKSM